MVTPAINSPTTTTPRGSRPKDRRRQIRSAATALFYERGYEQVSIADVAASVNVAPSALYRHFSSKAELLYEAIDVTINAFVAMVEDLPTRDLEGIARTAARTALAHRALGVLWQRESRNLPDEQRRFLRRRLRDAIGTLAATLGEIEPGLTGDRAVFLAAAGVNAMSSISFHRLSLPIGEFEDLLTELALRILTYQFPDAYDEPVPQPAAEEGPPSRRSQISDAATRLFAEHGFDAVSVDDVGAAVGIAGPSVYNHFASKAELLYDSLGRGYEMLQTVLADAVDEGTSPTDALRRVSDSYVELTLDHSDVITNLIAESRNLGFQYASMIQRAQLSYIGQWVALIHAIRPGEDLVVSRIKVQAAQMMANSVGRTAYLAARPGFRHDAAELCWILQQ
jgi:AcrR family transcriptional regulator